MSRSWKKTSRSFKDNFMPKERPGCLRICLASPQLEGRPQALICCLTTVQRKLMKLSPAEIRVPWERNCALFRNDAMLNVTTITNYFRRCSTYRVTFKSSVVSDPPVSRKFKMETTMSLSLSAKRNLDALTIEPTNGRALRLIVYGDKTRVNKTFSRTLNQLHYLLWMASMRVFLLTVKQEVVKLTRWRELQRITNAVLVTALFRRFSTY
mmetsp:Transcript_19746/g.45961  ORF Transcript_19746/g.45961 Transcript_19746/m.45961 type:complete len:210 (+) Transcript_19746:1713-2342(+)